MQHKSVSIYDVFKGHIGRKGKVLKVRSVGRTTFDESSVRGLLFINSLSKGNYYLAAENDPLSVHDFTIFYTESDKFDSGEPVGVGFLLTDENAGLIRLEWDIFGVNDMYVNIANSLKEVSLESAA
ncbi:MAG: hypothetical protein H6621_00060 [Halobacteriovoraceae bacterium]|nr:hypothetical protein [Halobacteriovoraceae bacterium]MCB9093433.1 hypothetical protein [Halobacteriovoraceae bacterium]